MMDDDECPRFLGNHLCDVDCIDIADEIPSSVVNWIATLFGSVDLRLTMKPPLADGETIRVAASVVKNRTAATYASGGPEMPCA